MVRAKGTLVILHGWTRQHRRWQPLIQKLQAHDYQIVYLKLPGFTGSDLDKPWHLEDYVSWVKERLKHQKVKRFFLVGHSNGGRISLAFASQNPPGLQGLILVASAGVNARPTIKAGLFWIVAKGGKLILAVPGLSRLRILARRALYRLARERDYFEAPKHLAQTMQHSIRSDLTERIKQITVPVLLVWGGKDQTTPLKDALQLAAILSQAHLTVFPDATHALPYQQPKKLAEEIDIFVQSCRS